MELQINFQRTVTCRLVSLIWQKNAFDCYYVHDIMQHLFCLTKSEIMPACSYSLVWLDNVFASGAVVGRATTNEWGRLPLRPQRSRATPLLRGGASNHGSRRRNVVNFHSTTIIQVAAINTCNLSNIIIRSYIGVTSFKSTVPSSASKSPCKPDDVTMIDECKQSTTTSSTHSKKNWQMNTFHHCLKRWMD